MAVPVVCGMDDPAVSSSPAADYVTATVLLCLKLTYHPLFGRVTGDPCVGSDTGWHLLIRLVFTGVTPAAK